MVTTPETPEAKLNRALELIGGSIDPEIAESYSSLEERILAQALENVELAERRLREIQKLVDDLTEVPVYRAHRRCIGLQEPSRYPDLSRTTTIPSYNEWKNII